jgi:hypothetical protein
MVQFIDFHKGNLQLYSLNCGPIILIPKSRETTTIQQYIPICLLNVSFKCFTKVATNRIIEVVQKVISPRQTTLLLRRNIMEGVIALHETIHEMHKKNKMELYLKLNSKRHMTKLTGHLYNRP